MARVETPTTPGSRRCNMADDRFTTEYMAMSAQHPVQERTSHGRLHMCTSQFSAHMMTPYTLTPHIMTVDVGTSRWCQIPRLWVQRKPKVRRRVFLAQNDTSRKVTTIFACQVSIGSTTSPWGPLLVCPRLRWHQK